MSVEYKIPSSMLADYAIVLPDGSEIPLQQLVHGFMDIADMGGPHDIHRCTGSSIAECELQYSMMTRLYSAIPPKVG